ncbi:MAG: putative bifunctional diguanylate cyclase/phosphodiesterase, partial [Pseudomonadales bacterium]
DAHETNPRLLRQIRVLNGLMLTAMGLCIPLGLFWAIAVDSNFSYVYLFAFAGWALLAVWLRRSLNVVLVGRLAVCVLFGLSTASVVLLGGTDSNLLAWFMLMPLAAAVCVGKRDLWFWGVIASITPAIIYLYPEQSWISPSPFSAEVNHRLSGIAISLGALVVSILTSIWMSHHEQLAKRLDQTVARLKEEAQAHRLLVDSAMLASAETELHSGARKLLDLLSGADWVVSAAFWDTRNTAAPDAPSCAQPGSASYPTNPSLLRSIRTGKRSVATTPDSDRKQVYYPVQDDQTVAGVLEVDVRLGHDPTHEGGWLLEQIAIQLGHIAERERTAEIIQKEARFDALTGLNNRRAFQTNLEAQVTLAKAENNKVALLFIDLNDFKRINDSLGHASGDAVLQVVANRLRTAVRGDQRQTADTATSIDAISRIGGDEFTLLMTNFRSSQDVESAAARIVKSLAAPIQLNEQQFNVGASIGIAIFPDDAVKADALVRSADAAMYAAKKRGTSGYSRYRDVDKAVDALSFEAEMRRALTEQQLEMHYQPVFSCAARAPVGAEALMRWRHPGKGWISPAEFIPMAESLGLIGDLGRFQFDTVLHWFGANRAQLPKDFRIALNLSPMQLKDSEFVNWLIDRLGRSKIPPENVELEITETALLADTEETRANVRALAKLGHCIALDDFGTGHSSLSLLKRFPIGRIKIDQSFVSGLPERSEDVAIVGAVLSLARSLDIPVVAEGVENSAQELFLKGRGCDDMQGYLLAKPMPGADLTEFLASAPAFTSYGKTALESGSEATFTV